MKCPKCGFENSKVLDSRPLEDNIRRRRQCENCNYRFSTIETIKIFDLFVQKRNGSIEYFNADKLQKGIRKAFNKRRINEEKIQYLLKTLNDDIIKLDINPISTMKIGEMVLNRLLESDEAAYICFWAMFGNFENIEDFINLINQVKNKSNPDTALFHSQGSNLEMPNN
jgi:transcriptional repressor NrdR